MDRKGFLTALCGGLVAWFVVPKPAPEEPTTVGYIGNDREHWVDIETRMSSSDGRVEIIRHRYYGAKTWGPPDDTLSGVRWTGSSE